MLDVSYKFMKQSLPILAFFGVLTLLASCLSSKSSINRYNLTTTLQLENSNKWIETIKAYPSLKQLRIEITSKKWDHYEVNDSMIFFGDHKELANYHSYKTFGKRLNIDPELLKSIIFDFDKLGLNRFYRVENYFLFITESYLTTSSGYLYLVDEKFAKEKGDLLFGKYLLTNKYDSHWFAWKEPNH
jgi:hypothetical protein